MWCLQADERKFEAERALEQLLKKLDSAVAAVSDVHPFLREILI